MVLVSSGLLGVSAASGSGGFKLFKAVCNLDGYLWHMTFQTEALVRRRSEVTSKSRVRTVGNDKSV